MREARTLFLTLVISSANVDSEKLKLTFLGAYEFAALSFFQMVRIRLYFTYFKKKPPDPGPLPCYGTVPTIRTL
jgi:hypothetical protein